MTDACNRPPQGWVCSRGRDHEGPCAARQCDEPARGGMSWPSLIFYLAVLATLATCYLGKIEALPWQ